MSGSGQVGAAAKASFVDYTTVTEAPGTLVSPEAMKMVRTRYAFAASHVNGRAVLEVACGPGPGLGMLAASARVLVAGDFTECLLRRARAQYGSRVPLVRLDATHLPFLQNTFDVILLFEAIYFLPDFSAFLNECRRLLNPAGEVLVVTVNPEWDAFNPSPFSTRYWTAAELAEACRRHGFSFELSAGFPAQAASLRHRVMRNLKRMAVKLNLMPKTMKGKELLKRIAFGKLEPFPAEVTPETVAAQSLVSIADPRAVSFYKVLYVSARKEEF